MNAIRDAVVAVFGGDHSNIIPDYSVTYHNLTNEGVLVKVRSPNGDKKIQFEIFPPSDDVPTYIGVIKTRGLRYSQITALMDAMIDFL